MPAFRIPVVLLVSAAVLACASRPPTGEQAIETAEFLIQSGDSVVAVEHTVRWPHRLEGQIQLIGQTRADYVATLDGTGAVTRLQATLRTWDDRSREEVDIAFGRDSVVVRSSRWAGVPQSFAGRATAAYLHPSPALLELMLQRADWAQDSAATFGVWLANQNVRTTARVQQLDGQPVIELAGTRMRAVEENGALVSGEVRALGWTVHRRPR
jgi:hypothetical protein